MASSLLIDPPAILARWRGPIRLAAEDRETEPRGLERLVISDEAAYRAFVDRIPIARVQMKQPAPPSDDPLLARPPIDFAREVIVAVVRSHTVSAAAVLSTAIVEGVLHVRYQAPRPPPEARPYGIGVYTALHLARPTGAIVFEPSE